MREPSFKMHMALGIVAAVAVATLFLLFPPELGRREDATAQQDAQTEESRTPSFRAMSLSQLLSEADGGTATLSPVDGRWVSFLSDGDGEAMALIWVSDSNNGAAYPYVVHSDDLCVAWDADGETASVSQTENGMDPKTEKEYGRRYVLHAPASAKGGLFLSTGGDAAAKASS